MSIYSEPLNQVLMLVRERLRERGIESDKYEAEEILSYVTNIPRLELPLAYKTILTEGQTHRLSIILERRLNREPLQYILGMTCFWGFDFIVTDSVLIPRPETELLVEAIIKDYSEVGDDNSFRLIDVGTGSGCIAIVLAKTFPRWNVTATDISSNALAVAKKNAALHTVKKLTFVESDCLKRLTLPEKEQDKYDLIVSNPPYISIEEYNELQPEIKDYEPKTAFIADEEGIYFYRKILRQSRQFIKKEGRVYFEIGHNQVDKIANLAEELSYRVTDVIKDYQDYERIIKLIKK